jgi:NAD+ synthase (glutamine-hydrolysing)
MPTVCLGAASLNQTPLDFSGNAQRIVAAIDAARDAGVGLLCLPELCVGGYGCEDAFFADHVRERSIASLVDLLPDTHGIAVAIGAPLEIDGKLYNAAAMIADGSLLGFALKQWLADDGIHYEPRWFRPWPAGEVVNVDIAGESIPAGDLVFDLAGVGVGFEVCRDAWVDDRPACRLRDRGVQVILNPSASHFAFGKQAIRERLVREGSEIIQGAYVYANLLGNESGRAVYDGGTLIANKGEILLSGQHFSYRDHTLSIAEVKVSVTKSENVENL